MYITKNTERLMNLALFSTVILLNKDSGLSAYLLILSNKR